MLYRGRAQHVKKGNGEGDRKKTKKAGRHLEQTGLGEVKRTNRKRGESQQQTPRTFRKLNLNGNQVNRGKRGR